MKCKEKHFFDEAFFFCCVIGFKIMDGFQDQCSTQNCKELILSTPPRLLIIVENVNDDVFLTVLSLFSS
jgi:hypothetical protein